MKILVINGSPKGEDSNSLKLTTSFLAGMNEENVTTYHLAQLDVQSCRGCFSCWKNTPGKCVISDDTSIILSELIMADVVIWSFPLYYFSVPGILKNFIDRQLPLILPFMEEQSNGKGSGSHFSRYEHRKSRHVLISTCGFYSAADNYDAVISMFDHFCGNGNHTDIFCGQGELFGVPQLSKRTNEYLEMVNRAGAEFVNGAISDATQTDLRQLLYPKDIFEKMADASWGIAKEDGTKIEKSLSFTQQMAALYNKNSYDGKDRVLEICYTDTDKTYQIWLARDGSRVMTENFKEYTTRIETPFTVWQDIAAGKITGGAALIQHKYRVSGDFDIMIKWDDFFGGGASGEGASGEVFDRKTNMRILLMPWIVIWVGIAINPVWGSAAGIIAASVIPFCWLQYEATIFEYISVLAVSGISLVSLLGGDPRLLIALSYGLFGSMWFITAFLKTPLTAYYSSSNYGGKHALDNPLFVQTNRILTACWGVLYLLTPIWTWFLLGTSISYLTGAFNSILPLLMGIFTVWFQKWYPAKVAGE